MTTHRKTEEKSEEDFIEPTWFRAFPCSIGRYETITFLDFYHKDQFFAKSDSIIFLISSDSIIFFKQSSKGMTKLFIRQHGRVFMQRISSNKSETV